MTTERHAAHRRDGQSGQILILVALAMSALMGVGVVAADLGLLRVARGQLQSAAGSVALAAAAGLRHAGPDEALVLATQVAAANRAIADQMRPLVLLPDDLVQTGPSTVEVTLRRSPSTGGGVRTLFTRFVGLGNEWTVTGTSEAEVVDLCGTDALRPLVIPDRWADLNGNHLYDAGEPYSPDGTGYQPFQDEGLVLVLDAFEMRGREPATAASYLRVRLPAVGSGPTPPRPGVGNYRRFLMWGAPYTVLIGDQLEVQTVPVHRTTYRVIRNLIAADPGSYWDADRGRVVSAGPEVSPRIIKLALVDPRTLPEVPARRCQRRNKVTINRLVAAYIEDVRCNGRLTLRLISHGEDGVECTNGETSFIYRLRHRRHAHRGWQAGW